MRDIIDCTSMISSLQQWAKIIPSGQLNDSISQAIVALEKGDMTSPIEEVLDQLMAFITAVVNPNSEPEISYGTSNGASPELNQPKAIPIGQALKPSPVRHSSSA